MRAMPAEQRRKSKAITLDPQDKEAYELRGLVYANLWTLERAIADQSAKSLAGDNDAIVRSEGAGIFRQPWPHLSRAFKAPCTQP